MSRTLRTLRDGNLVSITQEPGNLAMSCESVLSAAITLDPETKGKGGSISAGHDREAVISGSSVQSGFMHTLRQRISYPLSMHTRSIQSSPQRAQVFK
jgi:hypothetical protein